jgi:hypothetical protein
MFGENVPLLLAVALLAQAVPQPFPGGPAPSRSTAQTPPPTVRPVAPPATQPAPAPRTPATLTRAGGEQAPSEIALGVAVYPNATFIGSYNAGQGQRYYLYGATASFAELVTYYRGVLRQRGELVFDEPATHMFDIGRFREETMAFPPSVTIKDYMWGGKGGYLNLKGGQPARFPTVIQIVPPPSGAAQ